MQPSSIEDPLCPFTVNPHFHSQPRAATDLFSVSWVILRSGIGQSYGNFMFNILKNCWTACPILQSHQQGARVPIAPHPWPHWVPASLLTSAMLVAERGAGVHQPLLPPYLPGPPSPTCSVPKVTLLLLLSVGLLDSPKSCLCLLFEYVPWLGIFEGQGDRNSEFSLVGVQKAFDFPATWTLPTHLQSQPPDLSNTSLAIFVTLGLHAAHAWAMERHRFSGERAMWT